MDKLADGKTGVDGRVWKWSGEDGEERGQGSVHSLSCCLIGRGSVRRAEVKLIRDVCHQLHFQANSQLDTAGGGLALISLLPPLSLHVCLTKI